MSKKSTTKKKSVSVDVAGETYEIEKLPLRRYADLFDAFEKIPGHLSGLDSIEEDQFLSVLPEILSDAFPEFVEVLAVATPVPKEKLENEVGLADALDLTTAIFEVNDYQKVGKVLGRLWKKYQGQSKPRKQK